MTGVLAVSGALLATVLGVIRVIDFLRERPSLKVWGDRVWLSVQGFPERREYYCFTAVNTGKRAVTVLGCFVEMKDGERVVIPPAAGFCQPLPKKLEIGEHVPHIVSPGLVDELRWSESAPRGVLFADAAGNEYRGPMNYSVEPRANREADAAP